MQLLASARILASDPGRTEEDRPSVAVDFEDAQSLYLVPSEVAAAADVVGPFESRLRAWGRVAASG
ncbi:hypothetical protein ACFV9W_00885 [Streptomyces sp. NPDC059897]|uniref:hypothetical protein n=1 Tax=Streptomyces sp. NPDC059897 TaxID=3346994 RepID=UPI0036607240